VQHEGHLSLAPTGMTVGHTFSILLRFRGGPGENDTVLPPAPEFSTCRHRRPVHQQCRSLPAFSLPHPLLRIRLVCLKTLHQHAHLEEGVDITNLYLWRPGECVYAQGSIGVHVENPIYWSALPLNRSGSVAAASDLDKTWMTFFKGLNVADLTAACKARSLHVVTASGSVKKYDFVTALQAWIHSHSVVISLFQDTQLLGLEASTKWWCACDAE